jgi:hypothetical protein
MPLLFFDVMNIEYDDPDWSGLVDEDDNDIIDDFEEDDALEDDYSEESYP